MGLLDLFGDSPERPRRMYGSIDPEELKRARWRALLGGVGAGLLKGRNLGEGLGEGIDIAHRGLAAERERLMQEAQAQEEAETERKQQEAVATYAGTLTDPQQRAFAEAYPDEYARSYAKTLFEGQDPITLNEGDVLLDPVTHQPIYSVPKTFAPERAPQLSLDATVIDPATGNEVYATGPLKGQIAKLAAAGGGFSLGPGQVRYDAAGNIIAAGPEKPESGFTLGPGQARYGANGEIIATGPEAKKALTEFERLAQAAGFQPGTPEYQAAARQKLAGSGGIQITGYDDQGRPIISIGGQAKPLTEGQSQGTMQFSLADNANKTLGDMDTALTSVPDFIASKFGTAGNFFKSPEYQNAEQAATVLAEQYLRALTGAAAPEPEVQRTAKSILPQPGDGPEVIAQKRATRAQIIEALRIKAGPGTAQLPQDGDILNFDAEGNLIP